MLATPAINIEALLANVPLFNGLEADDIARIARGTREVNAARGDILFHKGDQASGFYLIVYGQIKLAFTSAQGKELFAYGQDALKELRKVVWPTRQETTQTTLIVVAVVLVMALLLWGLDSLLGWLVSLIVG